MDVGAHQPFRNFVRSASVLDEESKGGNACIAISTRYMVVEAREELSLPVMRSSTTGQRKSYNFGCIHQNVRMVCHITISHRIRPRALICALRVILKPWGYTVADCEA